MPDLGSTHSNRLVRDRFSLKRLFQISLMAFLHVRRSFFASSSFARFLRVHLLLGVILLVGGAVPPVGWGQTDTAVAPSPSAAPWPSFGYDVRNSGQSPHAGPDAPVEATWQFQADDALHSSPVLGTGGIVYVGSNDTRLYALDAETGDERWHFETDGRILSAPAIGEEGTLYVGSEDGYLYAIDPDGEELWRFETGDEVTSSPAIGEEGIIYVGSSDGHLYAIGPNGDERWRFSTGDEVISSPAIGTQGTIYVGSEDGHLYSIEPSGDENWRFKTEGGVYSSPALGPEETVYVGSFDGNLYAVSPDGEEQWHFETGNIIFASPSIAENGTVYAASGNGNLYSIGPNGDENWRFETDDFIYSSPTIGDEGTVYVGSRDGHLYAIGPRGDERWRFQTGSEIDSSSPMIGPDGTVYVGAEDNSFYAIGAVEGSTPEPVHMVAEEMPELVGGMAALQNSVEYPEEAKGMGIDGRVFVQFVVDTDGNVHDPTITRGMPEQEGVSSSILDLFDEEALRAITTQEFEPGKKDGEIINVRMSLPVTFRDPEGGEDE